MKLVSACALFYLAAEAHAQAFDDPAWLSFKHQYGKTYSDASEEAARYAIFKTTLEQIDAHNARGLSYRLGVTKFADRTPQEYKATLSEVSRELSDSSHKSFHVPFEPQERATNPEGAAGLPPSVDWVAGGALPPVQNQDVCGVCWAFAATATLEAAQKIRKGAAGGEVEKLSEQQAIDCVGNGCDSGGWGPHWIDHLTQNQVAVCTEAEYPFQDVRHYKHSCQEGSIKCDNGLDAGSVSGKVSVENENDLLSAVYQQPTRIVINASALDGSDFLMFAHYSGGIIDAPCVGHIDHAVVVVGYGTEDGVDYWKVRNSWGDAWGEKGYFRIKRNNGQEGTMCMMSNGSPLLRPEYPQLQGAEACPDGYNTEWNFGCQSFCECNNPDGSKRNNCGQCCKVDSECHRTSPSKCPFGYSKTWNYPCQSACGCNSGDSHKAQCDKCCRVSIDGLCWYTNALQENNMTTFTATATPDPLVVV